MDAKLKKAMKLHKAGSLRAAAPLYERVLRSNPDDVTALHFYGLLQYHQGNIEKGVRLIRRALKSEPGYVDALHNLGNIYLETERFAEAELAYLKVVEHDPTNVSALTHLGTVLHRQQRWSESEEACRLATSLEPGSKEAWYGLGRSQQAQGKLSDAMVSFFTATEIDPLFSTAQAALCRTTYLLEFTQGKSERDMLATREAYERWRAADPDNPICTFMRSACEGEQAPERAPDSFVVRLFDEFADAFDQNLARLEYRVPTLIAEALPHHCGTPAGRLAVLDGGCGTGLLAEVLRPWAACLEGVDLSPGMLRRARQRRCYDRLKEQELTDFLQRNPDRFDLIVCADTLIYFGQLEDVLTAMARALKKGGRALFSVEAAAATEKADIVLGASGRYRHQAEYVQRCIVAAGGNVESLEQHVIRNEGSSAVEGLLVAFSTGEKA